MHSLFYRSVNLVNACVCLFFALTIVAFCWSCDQTLVDFSQHKQQMERLPPGCACVRHFKALKASARHKSWQRLNETGVCKRYRPRRMRFSFTLILPEGGSFLNSTCRGVFFWGGTRTCTYLLCVTGDLCFFVLNLLSIRWKWRMEGLSRTPAP